MRTSAYSEDISVSYALLVVAEYRIRGVVQDGYPFLV